MKPRNTRISVSSALSLNANSDQPLLQQIANHYRKQIVSGEIAAGHRLPTCLELGRSLGLAPQTVNRAFDLLAREGLVHRRRSLGTVVGRPSFENSEAPKANHRHRHAAPPVCLVMRRATLPNEEEDIAHDYLNGLMEGFNAWKSRFEIAYLQPDQPDVELVRSLVESGQTRGMINLGLNDEATDYLVQERFPMVMINKDLSARGVTSVVADHVRGYYEAWKCVTESGHRNVAFFGFKNSNSDTRLRECNAGRQLVENVCDLRHTIFAPDNATTETVWETLLAALGPWRAHSNWPTLFLAQTDVIAARLMRALHEHGLRIPSDISVIGFNDSLIARHLHPALTTLAKPRFKMGLAASQLLLDMLAKRPGSADRLQVFPVILVQRDTFIPLTNRNKEKQGDTMKTKPMRWTGQIAALAVLLMIKSSAHAAIQTNFNFDTDTVGLPPPGWLAIAQGTAGSTVDVTSAQSTTFANSLELRTQGDFTTGPDLARVLGLGAFTSNVMGYFSTNQISFSIRLTANASQQFRFNLVDTSGNNAGGNMQVLFRNGGVFAQYGTSGLLETNVVSAFNVDTWYDVVLLNRPVDNNYSISIYNHGGGLLGEVDNLPITEAVPDGLIFVNDGWINIGQTGQQSVFLDTLQIAQVPEPSTMAFVTLGGLVFLRARRGQK